MLSLYPMFSLFELRNWNCANRLLTGRPAIFSYDIVCGFFVIESVNIGGVDGGGRLILGFSANKTRGGELNGCGCFNGECPPSVGNDPPINPVTAENALMPGGSDIALSSGEDRGVLKLLSSCMALDNVAKMLASSYNDNRGDGRRVDTIVGDLPFKTSKSKLFLYLFNAS